MTDYIDRFMGDRPAVGDSTYALYYPYDNVLAMGFDTATEAWDWYADVTASDGTDPVEAFGAYVVHVQINRVNREDMWDAARTKEADK